MCTDKQRFVILISDSNNNTTALATILDNEDHWELRHGQYVNIVNDNISLCIVQDEENISKYEYTLQSIEGMFIELVNIETNTVITDKIEACKLIDILRQCDDCTILSDSKSVTIAELEINGQKLTISRTKLVGFGKNASNHKLKFSIKVHI